MSEKTALQIALKTAKDLGLDKVTVRELEALQIPEVKELTPRQIKNIRERESASQAVLALFLNVSPSTVQKWERGEVRPQSAALKLLNLAYKHGLEAIKG